MRSEHSAEHSAEVLPPLAVEVLDPDSDAGHAAADAISEFGAEVITRLRREGQPVPGRPTEGTVTED